MTFENSRSFYIGGAWVPPVVAHDYAVENPATVEVIGHISCGSVQDVDRAVAAARQAFPDWSRTEPSARRDFLQKVRRLYEGRLDEFAQVIMQELGCPIDLSRSGQAAAGLGQLDAILEALDDVKWTEDLRNGNRIFRESRGVAGLITPWNWPLNQIGLKVFAALAAGCTVVLKPSEITPFNAMILADVLHEAGCPKGVFNLVNGTGDAVGAALAGHPGVDCVSFTGSTGAGRAVYGAAASRIRPVSLELGGKSPSLIFADCDVEKAVRRNLEKLMPNSGQNCNAPSRLLVERSVYQRAMDFAAEHVESIAVGDPSASGAHLGPVANRRQYEHIQRLIRAAMDEDATLLAGGPGRPDGLAHGHFVRPTVFGNVSNDMTIARQEVFGPVAVLIPFDSEAEAVALANDSDYGLAAYVHTDDEVRMQRVVRQLKAGMVFRNGAEIAAGSPFGGVKQSGIGYEGGVFGIEEFLDLKLVA
ncbi:aldehyde dehydrogenase family protein [Roseibium sp.]|uniref:aldehyde dehydrogenase family protein n=1 Tax=Roseibium sp. TaxID=1936156 RepID=UPI003D1133C3